jgi:hypothetical protein
MPYPTNMLYGPPLGLAYLAFLTSDPLGRRQADFLDLKDPGSHLSREGSHFIVEGPEVRDATMATCFSKDHFFYGDLLDLLLKYRFIFSSDSPLPGHPLAVGQPICALDFWGISGMDLGLSLCSRSLRLQPRDLMFSLDCLICECLVLFFGDYIADG